MTTRTNKQLRARVIALADFVGIDHMSEGWCAHRLHEAVKAAVAHVNAAGHFSTDMKLSWSRRTPDVVTLRVGEFSLREGRFPYAYDAPLTDAIGVGLLADLEGMALKVARKHIEDERDTRLNRMAERRVERMKEHAERAAAELALTKPAA